LIFYFCFSIFYFRFSIALQNSALRNFAGGH
jgi:hypothetical protein